MEKLKKKKSCPLSLLISFVSEECNADSVESTVNCPDCEKPGGVFAPLIQSRCLHVSLICSAR